MKEITKEQVDRIVDEIYISVNENIAVQYSDNLSKYINALKDSDNVIQQSAPYFAAIKTAQDSCMLILKESLKELLCD